MRLVTTRDYIGTERTLYPSVALLATSQPGSFVPALPRANLGVSYSSIT